MTGHLNIAFAPLLPVMWLEIMAAIAALLTLYALLRGAKGGILRGAVFALLLFALADPSLIEEQREPLHDTALVVVDDSASMKIGNRAVQAEAALTSLTQKLGNFPDLDTVTVRVKGATETDLFKAINDKLSSIPRDRMAGIILITDGEAHDVPDNPANLPGPIHSLIAGEHDEIDRRIAITASPAYGIVGKNVTLTLRIEDTPGSEAKTVAVTLHHDDGSSEAVQMPIGQDVKFDVPVGHAGENLYAFSVEDLPHEITTLNNSTAVTINGIRDRLRVLLISGEPHSGGRSWRNLLKSDPAVDLIHFTILRSPRNLDGIPNKELSLIAFPVEELFKTKLSSFDLVIFDRFRQQSLVDDEYLENIARYVDRGGALLISNATDAGIPSLNLSPLARVLPTEPSGKVLTGSFVPELTDVGQRHPVTATLTAAMPRNQWGPWLRQTEAHVRNGEVLLTGLEHQPLLVLGHAGEGRVAQFLSDQFWLWARDYHGGGPQAELLKRTAHWLMNEPELDETALRAHAELADEGWQILMAKQSLHDDKADVEVTGPSGNTSRVTLTQGAKPGILQAAQNVSETGLYRIKSMDKDGKEILVMVGPVSSPEFGAMVATEEKLSPVAKATGGGIFWLADQPGGPEIKRTSMTGAQEGRGWLGLKQNDQYRVTGSKAWPLWPAWLAVPILLGAIMWAWRREGRS